MPEAYTDTIPDPMTDAETQEKVRELRERVDEVDRDGCAVAAALTSQGLAFSVPGGGHLRFGGAAMAGGRTARL